jgi:sulfate adenylyltransferase
VSAATAEPALIPPHGGTLQERLAPTDQHATLAERARSLHEIHVGPRALADLALLASGGFSPLTGFMGPDDYRSVVRDAHLAGGLPWTIPVTLAVSESDAPAEGTEVALVADEALIATVAGLAPPDTARRNPIVVATMQVRHRFPYDAQEESRLVYGTEDSSHPGVAAVLAQGPILLGGPVTVLRPGLGKFRGYPSTPAETRATIAAAGWRTVAGFQTRNPVHRAHEYIQKCALEIVDGLLLHPLVGETKADDIPADVRMRCYEVLLERYYPSDRVALAVLPAAMRYAGPREAVFHAIVRKNYGCTHFIVGRDHAGVGNYYGTYEAQRYFDRFDPAALGIVPLKFENSFFCTSCQSMASSKTCPHDSSHHLSLSGTEVRRRLTAGEPLPAEFSRPEVAQVLIEAARER